MATKVSGPRSGISILVCGRTGIGKSTLVNFILGKDVCKVNDPADGYDGQTSAGITIVEENMNGVLVTIYESSALQDGTANEQQYLDDLYSKCRDVDLVIYCQDMSTARMQPPEIVCLRLLTEKFGGSFWKKTVLVLTKANFVRPLRYENDKDKIEYFQRIALAIERKIQSEVAKHVSAQPVAPVPSLIGDEDTLTAVPAGSARDPLFFLLSGKHFIGNLYVSCLERIPQQKVKLFGQATSFCSRYVPYKPSESHVELVLLMNSEAQIEYPIYIDEEESERLKHLEIEVPCEFCYAGCQVTRPVKYLADHMKANSVAHISALARYFQQQLNKVTDENARLREEVTDLRKQFDQLIMNKEEIPRMDELLQFQGNLNLAEEIGNHNNYKDIGRRLLNDHSGNIFDAIERQYNGDSLNISQEILSRWIDGKGMKDRSWQGLIRVLGENDFAGLANYIAIAKDS